MKLLITIFSSIILFLGGITLFIMWETSEPNYIEAFPLKPQLTPQDWPAVFKSEQKLQYQLMQIGEIEMDRNDLVYNAPQDWDERFAPLPVLSHWISHPVYGEFLIDAGFAHQFMASSDGNYNWLMRTMASQSGISNSLGAPLLERLPKNSKKIEGIFLTHFHPDHSSGISDLIEKIRVIADINEYDLVAKLTNTELFEMDYHWQGFDFEQGFSFKPFDHIIDVFGDRSLFAVSTKGHTTGHTSYLLNTEQGMVFLAGDASHFSFAYRNDLAPVALSKELQSAALKSLRAIKTFEKMYPQIKMVFGHELPTSLEL